MLEPTPEMPASPAAGPSSGGPTGGPCSLEHLDNLCRLMEKLGELRDHNSKLQQRVQYLEDLKGLRGHAEAGTATAEEAIMKATEERFLGPASSSNARSFVKIGKRSGKFKPLQYSMSHTFGAEGSIGKESKWSKVKGALRWDRAPSAILKQTSPCSSAGQSPNVKRSSVKPVEAADPSGSGSSSSEELDPYFTLTDIAGDYDGSNQGRSLNQQNRNIEEGYRRSKSLEGEALFNHLRSVSTCQRQNRTPWGVVKGLIKTAKGHRHENSRLSFPSEATEMEGNPDFASVSALPSSTDEVLHTAHAQAAPENDPPSQDSREDSNNGQYRPVSTGLRRPSKWTKVKNAFLSGPVGPSSPAASSPSSPNRHSSFVYDLDWDVSEEAAATPRDEIRRSYLSLQQRLSQEFQRKRMDWERGGGVISEGATVVENEHENGIYAESNDLVSLKKSSTSVSIADDQHHRNNGTVDGRESSSPQPAGRLAWQRLKKSRTVPAVPLTDSLNPPPTKAATNRDIAPGSESPVDSQERGLRWLKKELSRVEREKMRLERERDRFLRREAKQRRQEVLVRTSGGLFRFQGISHQFTRRLFEWERSQGIAPQDSTLALLHPNYADSTGDHFDASSKLARSRSEGVVGARVLPDDDDEENDGLRKRILRYESDILNKKQPPPRLLRPKDFNSHFSERLDKDELSTSSAFQDREGVDDAYGARETPMGGLCKSRTRTKIRTRGKLFRQDAEDNIGSKQNQNHREETEQRQAAVLVSALSTQLLSLAQELEATLGSKTSNTPSSVATPSSSLSPKAKPAGEDITQLPSLLTNTVLQLRQGLKVLCKDHAEPSALESGSATNLEKIQSALSIDREENEDEDEDDEEERENLPKRWSNKRKLRKTSRRSSSIDQTTPPDVFVPTTRKIFSPINHDSVRSVVTYVVDEPTKDSDKHSDSASTASSDQSERTCPPPVLSPTPATSSVMTSTTTTSLPTWKSPSVRNVCSIVTPAWLRSGSRSQSSSPALRRRPTPPALPQSPGTTRRDKEAAPSIRMMIAKYNHSPAAPVIAENGTSPPGAWRSPGIERRVRLQMERYEQGILQTQPPGCVQKSFSAGAIRPPGILKSSSVGSIKTRVMPPPPAATATRLRTLRLQRAKQEFLSRTPQTCSVPLIKSASASVIECSKNIPESDSSRVRADVSPKTGMWRLRKVLALRPNEENSASCPQGNPAVAGFGSPGSQLTKSCPSSPVMERVATDETVGRSGSSSVGWMRFPGRIFRQK